MRKLITFIVASLIPVGMWTAGCRQNNNRQAAFPQTAEMKGLAKANTPASNKPPRIDPAPIDREVLNLPDSPAMARATAVKDKSKQMAKPQAPNDLFTLPDANNSFASAYDPRPADIGSSRGSTEFWSQPSAAPAGSRFGQAPSDVSAMAPANQDSGFMSPPVQFIPPSSSRKSTGYQSPMDVPGVFMDEPVSLRGGGPPSASQSLSTPFPGGDALGAPPPLNKRQYATKSEKAVQTEKGPVKLDLSGLLSSSGQSSESFASYNEPFIETSGHMTASAVTQAKSPPMIVHAIPGDYEPLPEPIPLEQYIAMLDRQKPEPAAAMMPRRRSTTSASSFATQTTSFKTDPDKVTAGKIRSPGTAMSVSPAPVSKTESFKTLPGLPELGKSSPLVERKQNQTSPVGTSLVPQSKPQAAEIKKALAPLPDISGSTPAQKSEKLSTLPESQPGPLNIPSLEQTRNVKSAKPVSSVRDKSDESTGSKSGSSESGFDGLFLKKDFTTSASGFIGDDFGLELPEPKAAPKAREKKTVVEKKTSAVTGSGLSFQDVSDAGMVKGKSKQSSSVSVKPKAVSPAKRAEMSRALEPLGISAEIQELKQSEKMSAVSSPAESLSPLGMPDLTPELPSWVDVPLLPPPPPPLSEAKAGVKKDVDAFADAFLNGAKGVTEEAAVPGREGEDGQDGVQTKGSEPPKKVKLQPMRKYRDKEMSKIDAQMDVPPMRF